MQRLFIVESIHFTLHTSLHTSSFILHTSLQLCAIHKIKQIRLPLELELWYY